MRSTCQAKQCQRAFDIQLPGILPEGSAASGTPRFLRHFVRPFLSGSDGRDIERIWGSDDARRR